MANFFNAGGAQDPLDMGAISATVDTITNFSSSLFAFDNAAGDVIAINGSGLTYDGSHRPTSGTANQLNINFAGGGGIAVGTLAGVVVSNLDGGTRAFWNEILKGPTAFLLSGLAQSEVGAGQNVIFGDDSAARAATGAVSVTDSGGDDVMNGADNAFDLLGDVLGVIGFAFNNSFAIYDAGDDTIIGGATAERTRIAGDARTVAVRGTLNGGDDELNSGATTNIASIVVGDVLAQTGGVVNGGDDLLTRNAAAIFTDLTGDVDVFSGGVMNGGADTLVAQGSGSGLLIGDVGIISFDATGTVTCGNDTITGAAGGDQLLGDLANPGNDTASIVAGADVINGGGGDDEIFGEVGVNGVENVTGGDDQLNGNAGADTILGQTGGDRLRGGTGDDSLVGGAGRDRLEGEGNSDILDGGDDRDRLEGGAGKDTMTGGAGLDIYVFAQGGNVDRITDFADAGVAADDLINVEAFEFASFAQIQIRANGNDAVLTFADGDKAVLVGYLLGHGLGDLGADDFVL